MSLKLTEKNLIEANKFKKAEFIARIYNLDFNEVSNYLKSIKANKKIRTVAIDSITGKPTDNRWNKN